MDKLPTEGPPATAPPLIAKQKSGAIYTRTKEVERQIRFALILSDEEIIANAKTTASDSSDYLRDETLVFLIKQSFKERNLFLYNALFTILLERANDIVSYRLRGLPANIKEDAFNEVNEKLVKYILRDDGKGDFLQVRFRLGIKRITIGVYRKFNGIRKRDHQYLEPEAFFEPDPDYYQDMDERFESNSPIMNGSQGSSVEEKAVISDALQKLDQKLRLVYYLHYHEHWLIESKNEDHQNLSKYFGVSGRTIRNWLYQAEEELNKWRGNCDEQPN